MNELIFFKMVGIPPSSYNSFAMFVRPGDDAWLWLLRAVGDRSGPGVATTSLGINGIPGVIPIHWWIFGGNFHGKI
jgi:hypothetical protein